LLREACSFSVFARNDSRRSSSEFTRFARDIFENTDSSHDATDRQPDSVNRRRWHVTGATVTILGLL
jgi:hypothetical protein